MARITENPAYLLKATPSELRDQLLEVKDWDVDTARIIDAVLREIVVSALTKRATEDHIDNVRSALKVALSLGLRAQVQTLPGDWAGRWSTLVDLLETRLEQMGSLDANAMTRFNC